MGEHASGAEGRRVYLDAIDEATQKAARGGARGPRRPRRQINDIAARRLRDVEKIAKLQREYLRENTKTAHADVDFIRAFNETTKTMANILETIRRGRESERKAMNGLTEERLLEVWRNELPKLVKVLTREDWLLLLVPKFGQDVADVLLGSQAEIEAAP